MAASMSAAGESESGIGLVLSGEQLQEVVERLLHASADRELLHRARAAAAVLFALHQAHDRPFERAERLPEAELRRIDDHLGGALIGGNEILASAHAAHRRLAAE